MTYDPHPYASHSNPDDSLYLYAFCPACSEGQLYGPVPRPAATINIELPPEWPSDSLHLYAFLCDSKGRSSKTIYVPVEKKS